MSADTAFEVGRLFGPIKAISDVLSASQKDVFVNLPGLAGYYPMGIRNQSGQVIEHSGTGANLLQLGTCPVGYDGNSFCHLGDGINYLYDVSSSYQITGTEAWIASSLRGLTIGGWFMVESWTENFVGLISKHADPPERGYVLGIGTDFKPFFGASGTGGDLPLAYASVVTSGQWVFVVGRFIPSTEVAVFLDGDKSTNTTAIPSSINTSTQDFEVGRYNDNDDYVLHGKARDVFVCASALSDALIEEIRSASAP